MRYLSAGNLAWLCIHVSVNIYGLSLSLVLHRIMPVATRPLTLCFVVYGRCFLNEARPPLLFFRPLSVLCS